MTYISVAVASLRLDVCDDGQVVEVDLEPLVESVLDDWLRTPGASPLVGADPVTYKHERTSLVLVRQGAQGKPERTPSTFARVKLTPHARKFTLD